MNLEDKITGNLLAIQARYGGSLSGVAAFKDDDIQGLNLKKKLKRLSKKLGLSRLHKKLMKNKFIRFFYQMGLSQLTLGFLGRAMAGSARGAGGARNLETARRATVVQRIGMQLETATRFYGRGGMLTRVFNPKQTAFNARKFNLTAKASQQTFQTLLKPGAPLPSGLTQAQVQQMASVYHPELVTPGKFVAMSPTTGLPVTVSAPASSIPTPKGYTEFQLPKPETAVDFQMRQDPTVGLPKEVDPVADLERSLDDWADWDAEPTKAKDAVKPTTEVKDAVKPTTDIPPGVKAPATAPAPIVKPTVLGTIASTITGAIPQILMAKYQAQLQEAQLAGNDEEYQRLLEEMAQAGAGGGGGAVPEGLPYGSDFPGDMNLDPKDPYEKLQQMSDQEKFAAVVIIGSVIGAVILLVKRYRAGKKGSTAGRKVVPLRRAAKR